MRGSLSLFLLIPALTTATIHDPYKSQRADYLIAEKALKKGQNEKYRRIRARLSNYPLVPYLDYQALLKRLDNLKLEEAEYFLLQNRDTPVADRFRRSLLNSLGKSKRWSEFLHFYRPDQNRRRSCLYAVAKLKTGEKKAALSLAPSLWLNGNSMPTACDPLFNAWRQEGRLTNKLVWKRIALAMAKRNLRLSKYLQRYLPADDKRWLKLWLKIDADPALLTKPKKVSGNHKMKSGILTHGLARLARTQPAKAASAWRQLQLKNDFTPEQKYKVERAIALGWVRTDHPQTIAKLDAFPVQTNDHRMMELRVREALASAVWDKALQWITALPRELKEKENWRYWRAKALAAEGKHEAADAIFSGLAKERSYHGFLSADRLGKPYNLAHKAINVSADAVSALAGRGGFQRAGEFFRLGQLINARREWRAATKKLSNDQLKSAAKLAQNWGWHSQAIFTLAKTGYWDDLELRFPLQHQSTIADAAKRKQLDKSWVLAVIRQESAFSPDARSHAGAMGLMQLMPATARATAIKMKRRPPKRSELLQPDTNIDIGTSYLKSVYDRLNDNTVLAISAYNAGPHRVKRWLPKKHGLEADLWVEMIPFRETRRYTQRVLAYSVIYDQRLGKKVTQLKDRMPRILPKGTKIQNASL